jgi:tRNA A-37 threonylcarbamoyl transferase component Bud32/tetratricopeptide (TPR) repeat protein
MSFNVGENVGPYRIIDQLGQGGMATVYKAYHAALDRYVALKVLHPAFQEDKSFEMRFQREARVVARLEHPHIVPVYDFAEHEHRPYLVMKFIEGETLKARIQRGPLTTEEIQHVVDSVGSALAYAHTQGILHRDIKPSNVLISTDGVMYLADFGLARIAEAGESTLSSDSIMGTPQYISPEQAMGRKDLDAGTDLYSFGVMLYEMVVGQVPFNADTPFSIIHDHIYTPLPLPRIVNPKVPETVERVLLKALAKDRIDRYGSVETMIVAFKNAWSVAGVPMRGTSINLPYTLTKAAPNRLDEPVETVAPKKAAARRFPWRLAAGSVVLLLCIVVGLAAFRGSNLFLRVEATAVVLPTASPAVGLLPPRIGTRLPGLNPEAASPEIQVALEEVQKNPDNAGAQFALSLAYWDVGQRRQAYDALTAAANLAAKDGEFLRKAADEYYARQAWIAAGAMYIRVMRSYPPGEAAPVEVTEAMRESVYKAAQELDARLYLQVDMVERQDQSLAFVMQGRTALFEGRIEEARALLGQAKRLNPDLREATLLEAEILLKEGRGDDARALLMGIVSDPGYSKWMQIMAEELLNTLK